MFGSLPSTMLNLPPHAAQIISPEKRYRRLASERLRPPCLHQPVSCLSRFTLTTASHCSSETMRQAGTSTLTHSDSGLGCCSFRCVTGFLTTFVLFHTFTPRYFSFFRVKRTLSAVQNRFFGFLPWSGDGTPSPLSILAIAWYPTPPPYISKIRMITASSSGFLTSLTDSTTGRPHRPLRVGCSIGTLLYP